MNYQPERWYARTAKPDTGIHFTIPRNGDFMLTQCITHPVYITFPTSITDAGRQIYFWVAYNRMQHKIINSQIKPILQAIFCPRITAIIVGKLLAERIKNTSNNPSSIKCKTPTWWHHVKYQQYVKKSIIPTLKQLYLCNLIVEMIRDELNHQYDPNPKPKPIPQRTELWESTTGLNLIKSVSWGGRVIYPNPYDALGPIRLDESLTRTTRLQNSKKVKKRLKLKQRKTLRTKEPNNNKRRNNHR